MTSIGRIFQRDRRAKRRQPSKRRAHELERTGFEPLELRAMLAFSPLPAPGSMGGSPIVLSSDAVDPANELTIILDDQTTPGDITATITTFDGTITQTAQYTNFSGITYSASNDTNGGVINSVKLWTSYEADLAGYETAPADDAAVGLSTSWVVASHFPAGGAPVVLSMLNADSLTVTSGVIGGNASTIAGEFESPTLAPDLDATTGANITLISGTGVTGADLGGTADLEPIVAYTLTLQSQTAGVTLATDVFTVGDLTIDAAETITLNGLLQSTSGDIEVESTSGQILLDGAELHALDGGITLRTLKEGIVQVPATAPNPRWQDYIVAETDVTIDAGGEVVLIGGVRANIGDIELSSKDRDIDVTGANALLHAVAGSVSATAAAGAIDVQEVRAGIDISLDAAQDIRVSGLVQAAEGLIRLETTSGQIAMESDAKLHAVAGSVELIAKRGQANLQNVFAGQDISVDSLGDVKLLKNVHSVNGNLTIVSNGGIDNAATVEVGDSISFSASRSVTSLGGGVVRIDLLSGGANYDFAIVRIAGPAAGGGRAATARATVVDGVVTEIVLIDPGFGYASGELVAVTIEGQSPETASPDNPSAEGARAQAFAAIGSSLLIAGEDITLKGGTLVEITNQIQAKAGDVTVEASAGPVKLSEIFAGEDVSLKAMHPVSIGGLLHAAGGNVDIESLGGGLDMRGTILAPAGGVEIDTAGPVIQRGGSVSMGKIFLLSGGRDYTYALVVVDPPPGAGDAALARAVITDRNPFDDEEGGYISEIVLLDGGWGYPSDSRINVRIQGDGEGAVVVFGTDLVASSIDARDDVNIRSGDSVTLVSTVRSGAGDVEILTTLGDVSVESITAAGAIDVQSNRGEVTLVSVSGQQDVLVNADQGLTVTDSLNTVAGNISLETTNGDITFVKKLEFGDNYLVDDAATVIEPEAVISTKLGGITMTAHNGAIVSPYVINANLDVTLTSLLAMELTNQITSQSGDIDVESTSSLVRVRSNMVAEEGSITVEAQTALLQEFVSGISKIELLSPGPMKDVPPAVTVTIAPPRNGGNAATAFAIIERRTLDNDTDEGGDNFSNVIEYEYFIGSIAIIDAGFGYEVGENPVVTITGVDGATARAYGPNMVAMLTAQKDINLLAGENVTLLTKIHAVEGNVTIASKAGDLDLTADSLFVSSQAGGIDIDAYGGSVVLQRLSGFNDVTVNAEESIDVLRSVVSRGGSIEIVSTNNAVNVRQLNAEQDVTVSGFRNSTLFGEIAATQGGVTAMSTAGGLRLNANIVAGDRITLEAQTFIEQLDRTGIEALEILSEGSVRQATIEPVPPTVTVDVAAPAGGGRAATARAILGRRFLGNEPSGTNPIYEYYIDRVEIIDAGVGYFIGESPIVTITGMPGAVVRGIGPTNMRNLTAGDGVAVTAVSDVTLLNMVTATGGDISIASTSGNLVLGVDSFVANATAGSVVLEARAGTLVLERASAAEDVELFAAKGVTVEGSVDAGDDASVVTGADGRVSVTRIVSGDSVTVTAGRDVELRDLVDAATGGVLVTSTSGGLMSNDIHAELDITLTIAGQVMLQGVLESDAGDVAVTSTANAVNMNADVKSAQGAVSLTTHLGLVQRPYTGVTQVTVVSGGSLQAAAAPTVTVTIAAPAGGGTAATATAVLEQTDEGDPANGIDPTWAISSIVLTSRGSGYANNETPLVTIAGMPGAFATAFTRSSDSAVVADKAVTVLAGGDVQLVTVFRSNTADVDIRSIDGNLDLSADTFFAHALDGNVTLTSDCGTVVVERACAELDVTITGEKGVTVERDVDAGRDITITAAAGPAAVRDLVAGNAITVTSLALASLDGNIVATAGDIAVTSTSGAIDLQANVHAVNESIALTAQLGILQSTETGVTRVTVVNGGQTVAQTPPDVTVTIAAPAAGGTAATAVAVVTQNGVTGQVPIWTVSSIVITNPGSGYAINELPAVTITGMPGAAATAAARTSDAAVVADGDLTVTAGGDVTLTTVFRSNTADVDIRSISGKLDLSANTFLAHALAGGATLTSDVGTIVVEKVNAAGDVIVTGAQGVDVQTVVESEGGDVVISARSGEANLRDVYGGLNVTVDAAGTVTLIGVIDSEAGDVSITSRNRDLDFTAAGAQVHSLQGGVSLAALNGTIMSPPTLHASTNVTLTSFNTLALNNEITSDTGVIDLKSTSGSINLGANLDARDDSIRINAKGSVTQIGGGIGFVRVLTGGSGYTGAATVAIAAPSGGGIAARGVPIIGRVNGVDGVITGIRLTNPGSGYGAGEQPAVTFARNAVPPAGALDASAMAVAAPALGDSGLAAIDVLDGGSGYTATTTVTIAAPVGGGAAATAQAVIGTVDGVDGVIVDIVIVNPGSGYGAGEQPVVTITGAGTGAAARAIANITLQDIRAGNAIDIYAGTGVKLLNTIRADQGRVSITSDTGNVNLAARTALVSSFMDDIEITARRGAINTQRLAAEGDITLKAQTGVTLLNAVNSTGDFGPGNVSIYTVNGNIAAVAPNGLISVQNGGVSLESVNGTIFVPQVFNVTGDVSLKTFGNLTINQPLTSSAGSVTVASTTGAVNIAANVFADERVTLSAKTGISQTKGFMKGDELVARNSTTSAVNLTSTSNDFANVSLMSLGAVSYVDANDFETGVERNAYSGTPLGVEITGDALTLSSVAPFSRIRVVSGLRYRTLSIAAGTVGGSAVGYVDYVTTSGGDNPQSNAAFQGTLRDMIRYSNDNTATYLNAGNTRVPQPQAMVFDEYGYTVEEVNLGAALPAFMRPVFFDGGRLEEMAAVDRIGIAGNSTIAYGLAFAPATAAVTGVSVATPGSAGSTIRHVAAYGFTKGSAIVLASGNNTVLDLHAGLKADGTVPGNFVGLDVSGAAAVNNQIGVAVFDPNTVNRFGGNTSAGILIRNGATGTRVFGSVIGDDTGFTPALANGDGIRISNATGNVIGTPDEVQVDLSPSRSNLVVGNTNAGILITNSVAGTPGAANVVRNNLVAGNGTGVAITASKFAVLGGIDGRSANVIVGQAGAGVAVANSTNVQIQDNRVGVVPAFGFDAEAVRGNVGDGIAISGASSAVAISNANWIGGNGGNGVSIGAGTTGVLITNNVIGGALADGTPAGNARDGVAINAAVGNTVGAGNTIASNLGNGVSMTDARAATLLAGNRVVGSTMTANGGSGVFISGGSFATVGGTTAGAGNVISGNAANGVRIESSARSGAAAGHAIQGNRIGTNFKADVDPALGNVLSGISIAGATGVVVGNGNMVMNNSGHGIEVIGGSGNTVGAATAGAGNVISNNNGSGVAVGGGATGVTVMGNTIAAQGADGVNVAAGVRGVRIGHIVTQQGVTGAGNVIRGNAGVGVSIGANAQQIAVQGNTLFDNGGAMALLGSGLTAANKFAPTMVRITSAVMQTASGGVRQLVVSGSLTGTGIQAKQQYSVDLYADSAVSTAVQAQGRRFLGRFTVTATANGQVSFTNVAITTTVAVNEWITATATSLVFDPGSTSRLSTAVQARLR